MSEAVHVPYGSNKASVQEQQKLVVTNCPDEIEEELQAAGFVRQGSRFVKKRPRFRMGGDGEDAPLQVLSARTVGSTIHVTAEDVVGMVQLLPGLSVHVEPKVGWGAAFEMLLTVYDIDRTQSFYGIPLEDLTASDVASTKILSILAINYIAGMREIRRNGVIRELHIKRRQGFEGSGAIDVEQTLVNQVGATQAPTWIETEIEHSNRVNETLLLAGRFLLRMLTRGHAEDHPRIETLLSMVHREVQKLENLGIDASPRNLTQYRSVSIEMLPRQRHYYRRALHASRSILSSVLLGSTGSGAEELLVDYALSMNSLFEDYSHRLIEEILQEVKSEVDRLNQLETVRCDREYPLQPFAGNPAAKHEPDHLLQGPNGPIAILDSKYYEEESNPANESGPRSRMFAYAYLTGSNRMAFLCPQLRPITIQVEQTDGVVEIVSPTEEFTPTRYRDAVRDYVIRVLADEYPELKIFEALHSGGMLALERADESDFEHLHDIDGPFSIDSTHAFADRVISAVTFSPAGPNKSDLPNKGRWTRERIRSRLEAEDDSGRPLYPKNTTTCVPIYLDEGFGEYGSVQLYFIRHGGDDIDVEVSEPIRIL